MSRLGKRHEAVCSPAEDAATAPEPARAALGAFWEGFWSSETAEGACERLYADDSVR